MTRFAQHRAAALSRKRRTERQSKLLALGALLLVLGVMAGLGAFWIVYG